QQSITFGALAILVGVPLLTDAFITRPSFYNRDYHQEEPIPEADAAIIEQKATYKRSMQQATSQGIAGNSFAGDVITSFTVPVPTPVEQSPVLFEQPPKEPAPEQSEQTTAADTSKESEGYIEKPATGPADVS